MILTSITIMITYLDKTSIPKNLDILINKITDQKRTRKTDNPHGLTK